MSTCLNVYIWVPGACGVPKIPPGTGLQTVVIHCVSAGKALKRTTSTYLLSTPSPAPR